MCNLYKMTASVDELRKAFGSFEGDRSNLNSYDAIYPDMAAPILKRHDSRLTLSVTQWGVPGWKAGMRPITNVRNLESSFWKSMLMKPENRCLVPVTQFCEWEGEKGNKRKVWFEVIDQPIFAFAGIWRETDDGPRFAFLTCEPNEIVAPVHPKAMPVILKVDDFGNWLEADYFGAFGLAQPYPAEKMQIASYE